MTAHGLAKPAFGIVDLMSGSLAELQPSNDGDALLSTSMRELEQLTDSVRAFGVERDWQQFHTPKNLTMALAGEVGELVAEFQWLTPDESVQVMGNDELGKRVRAEIGDVMI